MSWCWTAIGNMLDRLGGVWTPAGGGATCYWNSPYTPQSHISDSDAEIKACMELIIKECEPGNSSCFSCRILYISIHYFNSRDLAMGSDFFPHYIKVLINTSKNKLLKAHFDLILVVHFHTKLSFSKILSTISLCIKLFCKMQIPPPP